MRNIEFIVKTLDFVSFDRIQLRIEFWQLPRHMFFTWTLHSGETQTHAHTHIRGWGCSAAWRNVTYKVTYKTSKLGDSIQSVGQWSMTSVWVAENPNNRKGCLAYVHLCICFCLSQCFCAPLTHPWLLHWGCQDGTIPSGLMCPRADCQLCIKPRCGRAVPITSSRKSIIKTQLFPAEQWFVFPPQENNNCICIGNN